MFLGIFIGIMIPLIGTLLGSAGVFVMRDSLSMLVKRCLSAIAGGIMVAASIWSLIIPSLELTADRNGFSGVWQTLCGFMTGIVIMIYSDKKISNLLENSHITDNGNVLTQFIAITLHNIPEGMAVGMVYSALLADENNSSYTAALMLSLGIAAQNVPEGAIISMPLHAQGVSKSKSFMLSTLSGIVEPVGAALAVIFSRSISVLLPFLLSFAAGAMVYVVTEKLIPEMYSEKNNSMMTVLYSAGFLIMMSLDVIFG